MNIIIEKNYDSLSETSAQIIRAEINKKPNMVLGLATGSTPIGTYKKLIEMNKTNAVDFENVTTFNLDEYCGLSKEHNQSYYYFMFENLFNHININKENVNIPNGIAEDYQEECSNYEKSIYEKDGIDLQLLGLGHNGHIAFNEPDNNFSQETHKVALQDSTINANKRFFGSIDDVPKYALTMGIKTIMQAKQILVIASGKDKAEAVKNAVLGEITPKCPASVLQLHQNVTFVLDSDAASLLNI